MTITSVYHAPILKPDALEPVCLMCRRPIQHVKGQWRHKRRAA